MRMLMIVAAIALSGCATAVNESLDRRGVDSAAMLAQRVSELQTAAGKAEAAFKASGVALAGVDGLDGVALARQLDSARLAGQDASIAAQDVRLTSDSARAAVDRHFRTADAELALMPDNATKDEAIASLEAASVAANSLFGALDAAALRISPALKIYDDEVTMLRRNATSGVYAASRASQRASVVAAADGAAAALGAVDTRAEVLISTIKN